MGNFATFIHGIRRITITPNDGIGPTNCRNMRILVVVNEYDPKTQKKIGEHIVEHSFALFSEGSDPVEIEEAY